MMKIGDLEAILERASHSSGASREDIFKLVVEIGRLRDVRSTPTRDDSAPRLPLKAHEWEFTNTKSPLAMDGWWLIATHTESSVDTQYGQVVFVWARRKPAKDPV